ncbi:MAG: T9SS type A sorting domain-containing protein, partial [Bacteroidales bacterium]|nr:T9SS type A sorting domain-containing protein [Bacteroidales bacterium]
EDCIFHDFTDYIVHGMKDSYARGAIQDTVFINNVTVYHAKHFLQYKHVSLHHLEMTNTTVYGLQGMALKIGKIGYRTVAGVTDPTITPTGFIDHCTLDDLGDIHGHIQVDDAYHLLTISNCIISHQQQYDQPPVYFTGPAVNPAVSIQNTGFWEVGPPNAEVGGEDWIGYEFSDTTYKDPRYLGAPGGDFSLPDNSIYLSWSSENGQIGDTNWGTYVATGLSGDRISGEQELQILQTYPNPFCNETTIQYLLTKKEMVSIKIYAASGKEIITLENTVRDSGIHIKTWYAKECEAGIYFCIMEAGETSGVKKLILIK